MLSGLENVVLLDPLDYVPFVHLMKKAYLVLTDREAYNAMASKTNPYGDGTAAAKTVKRILEEASL